MFTLRICVGCRCNSLQVRVIVPKAWRDLCQHVVALPPWGSAARARRRIVHTQPSKAAQATARADQTATDEELDEPLVAAAAAGEASLM